MSQNKKFIVTSQANINGIPGAMEPEKGVNSSQTQAAISPVVTVVVTDMDGNDPSQNRPSRFRTERARMDSTSSMSTDDEQDPTMKAMEESSYVDSITSTSSTGSTKPLLSSVKELAEVLEDELEDRLARSNTMKGLLENPSYIDSLTTSSPDHRRLARACRKALALRQKQEARREKTLAKLLTDKDEKTGLSKALTTIPEQGQVKKGTYVKNVVLLSIGAMLSYTAFLSLRNLQSSLNHQKGVGLISLAGGYSMFMMGSLISPFVVKALRPKRAILLAILMQVLYVAVNMYPSFYTLVPSTMVVGMCNAFLWVAVNTYLTYLSADYAKLSGKPLGSVMSSFFGIYFMVFQMNNIFGNLLSSLILFSGQSWKEISSGGTSNGTFSSNSSGGTIVGFGSSSGNLSSAYSVFNGESSFTPDMNPFMSNLSSEIYSNDSSSFIFDPVKHCGANHCHSFPIDQASGNKVTDLLRYILMGALGTFAIFGFLTIFCFVEALKTYKTKLQCGQAVKEIKAVFSVMKEGKFLLLLPLQVYMGLEMSFLPGDILKAFVTCPVGIQMVGYVMVAYGASTALSSYVSGRLHKVVGRLVLICSAGLINVAMFTALYVVRTREGDWLPILLTVISWGVGDGVWNTQVNSCIATMFVKKSEPALAANRFASGFGVTLSYAYAPFLCMKTKIITTGSLCIVGVTCFVVLDLLQRRSRKNFKVTQV